jgi:hypothetical protein
VTEQRYVLGGRAYTYIAGSTIRHRHYLEGLLARHGLTEMTLRDGESPETFARRTLSEIKESGAGYQLLAGFLVDEGTPHKAWRPAMAERIAEQVADLDSDEDAALVDSLLMELLIEFFVQGLTSLWRSRKSGSAAGQPAVNEPHNEEPSTQVDGQN